MCLSSGQVKDAAAWSSVDAAIQDSAEGEIRALIGAYYAAVNRKSVSEIKQLWIPTNKVEICLPGCPPMVRLLTTMLHYTL